MSTNYPKWLMTNSVTEGEPRMEECVVAGILRAVYF